MEVENEQTPATPAAVFSVSFFVLAFGIYSFIPLPSPAFPVSHRFGTLICKIL